MESNSSQEFWLIPISLKEKEDNNFNSQELMKSVQVVSLEDNFDKHCSYETSEYNDEEVSNDVIQEQNELNTQWFYAVDVSQDGVSTNNISTYDAAECDDQFVPENNEITSQCDQVFEDLKNAVEPIRYIKDGDIFSPNADTNVYLLREHDYHYDHVKQQETNCGNVLQECGYEFVNESRLPCDSEECENVDVETLGEVVSALKCIACDFTTLDKTSLLQHHSQSHCINLSCRGEESYQEKRNAERIVYVCGQCTMELPSTESCRQHMVLEHNLHFKNKEPVSQNGDEKVTAVSAKIDDQLNQYWLDHGSAKTIKSRLCSDRKIRCTFKRCGYRFSTVEKMKKHKTCHATDSSKAPYKCSACEEVFDKWSKCSMHLHKHHQISLDVIICPICKSYTTYSVCIMATHLQKHAEQNGDSDADQGARWYSKKKCQICEKTYINSKILNKHMKVVHYKLKPFKCNVCGHSTSSKSMLQLHMRQHTGEKPYQCEYCPYRTGDHNTLHKHQKTHTKIYSYACELCPYKSIQSGALRAHMKSRHRETVVSKGNLQETPS